MKSIFKKSWNDFLGDLPAKVKELDGMQAQIQQLQSDEAFVRRGSHFGALFDNLKIGQIPAKREKSFWEGLWEGLNRPRSDRRYGGSRRRGR